MSGCKVNIYGEIHSDRNEVNRIYNEINKFNPDVLLHELLYEDVCLTREAIKKRISDCRIGNLCDPRFNRDVYEYGYDNNIPIIGIDKENAEGSVNEKFRVRERHMLEKIEEAMKKYKRIAVVVGDTHIRTKRSATLGAPSVIYTELRYNPNIKFIRSSHVELN